MSNIWEAFSNTELAVDNNMILPDFFELLRICYVFIPDPEIDLEDTKIENCYG